MADIHIYMGMSGKSIPVILADSLSDPIHVQGIYILQENDW